MLQTKQAPIFCLSCRTWSGIQKPIALKLSWIPGVSRRSWKAKTGQARNDKSMHRQFFDSSDKVGESANSEPRVYFLDESLIGKNGRIFAIPFNASMLIVIYHEKIAGWPEMQNKCMCPRFFIWFTQVSQNMCKKCIMCKCFHNPQIFNILKLHINI